MEQSLRGLQAFITGRLPRGRKQRASTSAREAGTFRLVEATVEAGKPVAATMTEPGGLLIELPGGGRVRVESPMQLRLAAELLSLVAQGVNQNSLRRC